MSKDKDDKKPEKKENPWLKQLKAYDDAVDYNYDSFAEKNCLYTPSPYFNWIFANKSNGIPRNSSLLLLSEQKAGKSLSCYAIVEEMQRRDPEGIAIYFNTELRGALQHGVFAGLDKDRFVIYDTKDPEEIFDRVEKDIKAMVQDGMPLRIIIIDSLTNIQGIKRRDADSVSDHLRGDHALTIQTGLDKLVPFCKRNKIMLIGTSQMRANQKATPGGPDTQMAESWTVKHTFEYFVSLKRAGSADDKVDLDGKAFEEEGMKDARDNKLVTGHKIYVKCEANSIGSAGRSGVFTMDYEKGIINQHEEIFFLGKNTGVIKLQGQTYSYGNHSIRGQAAFANLIKEDRKLYDAILADVKKLDEK
jgi:RecA/RadA recombinase